MNEYKPILAITMGDAAGSGPEIVVKALAVPEMYDISRPFVIGDAATMAEALKITKVPSEIRPIIKVTEAEYKTVFG